MKALSLHQPWASLIAIGAKRFETRHWATSYRGPLAIHAAKKWNRELAEYSEDFESEWRELLSGNLPRYPPLGCILAVAELTDCGRIGTWHHVSEGELETIGGRAANISPAERAFGNWEPGRFAWRLADVRPLVKPISFRGAQGLFEVPDELIENADFELSADQLARALR